VTVGGADGLLAYVPWFLGALAAGSLAAIAYGVWRALALLESLGLASRRIATTLEDTQRDLRDIRERVDQATIGPHSLQEAVLRAVGAPPYRRPARPERSAGG
jgi:hypothetical protein